MKTVYFDCLSGISGDMTLGALVDAGVSLDALNEAVGSLGLPHLHLEASEVRKKGFRATQVSVHYGHEHAHRHLSDIEKLIEGSILTEKQRQTAMAIFTRLAEAEAKVHGTTIEKVHFHEVGAADSIADIVGAAVGLDLLGVERIVASPITTGTGTVKIAHGVCSVPAPATAELLCGAPIRESSIPHELTTPTGAAILAALAHSFGPVPSMSVETIGYGAGNLDLDEQPNVLRIIVGQSASPVTHHSVLADRIWSVETNIDDACGELIGRCIEKLWTIDGVLDVYTTAIQMKKNRPGVKLSVLCGESVIRPVESVIFRETSTIGIRRWAADRSTLSRETVEVETSWGTVTGKVVRLPDGTLRFSPEFETCRQVADKSGIALAEVYEAARSGYVNR